MYAVLIAGGKGERLRPLTNTRPKPMVEVAGKPVMAYQVDWLIRQGIDHFIVSCGYLHEVIEEYFGTGASLGVHFEYAIEETPLGRGGGLRQGFARIPPSEPLVIATNADILTNQPLAPMLAQHRARRDLATLLLTPYVSQFGIVEFSGTTITKFTTNPILPFWINGGVYVMDRAIQERLPLRGDHEDTTFPELAAEGRLGAFPSEAYWRALDSVKDHANLNKELSARPFALTP
ncbi:MAG: nucleotidyltransferase family protein [Actinobacteria bacterium]|nr:nucleotidyltransferase family protein [Actinomycetota bacterium]